MAAAIDSIMRIVSHYSSGRLSVHGFTLLELTIALSMFAIFAAGAVISMTQVNRHAANARLRTLALGVAQQRIDEVLTVPWSNATRPAVLMPGTRTDNNIPLNNDSTNAQAGLSSAFTNLDTQVNATRVTEITDVLPRKVRAVVTVTYSYRNRNYSISLTTLRATDEI